VHAPTKADRTVLGEDARGELPRDSRHPGQFTRGRGAVQQVVQEEVRGDGKFVDERAGVVDVAFGVDLAFGWEGHGARFLKEADTAALFY
jgi:hypothetical protein